MNLNELIKQFESEVQDKYCGKVIEVIREDNLITIKVEPLGSPDRKTVLRTSKK